MELAPAHREALFQNNLDLADQAAKRQPFFHTVVQPDDIKQLARLAIWRASQKFPGEGDFRGYAWVIIQNAITDEFRRIFPVSREKYEAGQRVINVSLDNAAEIQAEPVQADRGAVIDGALKRLQGKHRVVAELVLRGVSLTAISKVAKIPERTTYRLFSEVLTRMYQL